jgi:hypothetical protein
MVGGRAVSWEEWNRGREGVVSSSLPGWRRYLSPWGLGLRLGTWSTAGSIVELQAGLYDESVARRLGFAWSGASLSRELGFFVARV